MSKVEVDQVTQQSGTTLTVGGGACKTAVVDATTVTLGRCGGTVSLASGATQSGFGRTGTVDWDTSIKTGTVTAVSGSGYFVNTTSGGITVNLPAASVGDIVAVSDYASTAASNNITVEPNGSDKINGTNASYKISTAGLAVTLVYADAVRGWKSVTGSDADSTGLVPVYVAATVSGACNTLTTCGNYKLATFLGPGTFCVSAAGNPAGSDTITTTTVAGAAGGGARGAGGGGAGGMVVGELVPVSIQGYPVVVGGGGAGSPGPSCTSTAGSNSTSISFTGLGGGAAGSQGNPIGQPGGSGGGAGDGGVSPLPGPNPGGSATQPGQCQPAKSVFNAGNAGGDGSQWPSPDYGGGGGGGATAAGVPADEPDAATFADGGAGKDVTPYFNLSPSLPNSGVYAGGGGGGINTRPRAGRGGAGGGGGGSSPVAPTCAVAGTTNTGGGGGGGTGVPGPGANGGSGIVIIEYKYQN